MYNLNQASTQAASSKELNSLLSLLPDHSDKSYDGVLREISNRLIHVKGELSLLRETNDICDEVRTIAEVMYQQMEVLGQLRQLASGPSAVPDLVGKVRKQHGALKLLEDRALKTRTFVGSQVPRCLPILTFPQLEQLLDFKQKQSNVMEAHFSRRQAESAARQGNIIMLFTMMTILFVSDGLAVTTSHC